MEEKFKSHDISKIGVELLVYLGDANPYLLRLTWAEVLRLNGMLEHAINIMKSGGVS